MEIKLVTREEANQIFDTMKEHYLSLWTRINTRINNCIYEAKKMLRQQMKEHLKYKQFLNKFPGLELKIIK